MILHVDMDAFYASIEQRDRPELRGRPVVVGGTGGRGVVQAASYEARRFGIHSAMPGQRAVQLCPDAVFVKGRMSHYVDVGRQVRAIFHRFTPLVQPLSLDEAFLDVTGSRRLYGSAETIGRTIKQAIADEVGLTASVGIAPLKFVAKIASDLQKPDGFVMVDPSTVQAFLDPLPVSRLWGVGKVGQRKLGELGIRHIVDIRKQDADQLRRRFGSWGEHLWRLANGIDPRGVVPDRQAKQISHERTFSEDQTSGEVLSSVVSYLSEQTAWRLRRSDRVAKTVTLKYRREDFETFTRARTLPQTTDSTGLILETAMTLLEEMRQRQPRPVRLIGVSLGGLTDVRPVRQMSLFDDETHQADQRAIDRVSDNLRDAMGDGVIHRASSHVWSQRRKQKPSDPPSDADPTGDSQDGHRRT
ncbi:DNA polymerase IV [Crateriforma spongiae]|uniref:DNA polymerase IV n=1 Tax=Crateriforma spongiae TaxID=2724528 RepID=UPI001447943B|nr:DNA polymerase IV [Crateriforma spongiae]